MDSNQTGSKYDPRAKVRIFLSGVMSKKPVIDALFKDPEIKTESVVLKGYGLRIQDIDDISPKTVREDMKKVWGGRSYLGAVGVVRAEGEEAEVTMVKTTLEGWKKANKVMKEFNYHTNRELSDEGKKVLEPWFHNEIVPGQEKGTFSFVESFADTNKLRRIKDVYPNRGEFEAKIDELGPTMADDIEGFRKNVIEGNTSSGEQKA